MIRDVERARDILRRRQDGEIYKAIGRVHNIGPVRVREIHLQVERIRAARKYRGLPHSDADVFAALEALKTEAQERK